MMKKILIATLTSLVASVSWSEQACFSSTILQSTPTSDFVVNGDGTVTDQSTGLMWQVCSLGQTFANGACSGDASGFSWKSALEAAPNDRLAGYGDWRLPNVKELESLVEQSCINPSVNSEVIVAMESRDYWTSTPAVREADSALAIEFYYGEHRSVLKEPGDTVIFARLVRDAN